MEFITLLWWLRLCYSKIFCIRVAFTYPNLFFLPFESFLSAALVVVFAWVGGMALVEVLVLIVSLLAAASRPLLNDTFIVFFFELLLFLVGSREPFSLSPIPKVVKLTLIRLFLVEPDCRFRIIGFTDGFFLN